MSQSSSQPLQSGVAEEDGVGAEVTETGVDAEDEEMLEAADELKSTEELSCCRFLNSLARLFTVGVVTAGEGAVEAPKALLRLIALAPDDGRVTARTCADALTLADCEAFDVLLGLEPVRLASAPAACIRAMASDSVSQVRLVPGLATSGSAKHVRSEPHDFNVHADPTHCAKDPSTHADCPSVHESEAFNPAN